MTQPGPMPWDEVFALLGEARKSPRLTPWEQAFVRDFWARRRPVWRDGTPKFAQSDREDAVLVRIREKIRAA